MRTNGGQLWLATVADKCGLEDEVSSEKGPAGESERVRKMTG